MHKGKVGGALIIVLMLFIFGLWILQDAQSTAQPPVAKGPFPGRSGPGVVGKPPPFSWKP